MYAILRRLLLIVACLSQAGETMAAGAPPVVATARIVVTVRLKPAPAKPTVTVTASDPFAAENKMNWGAFGLTRTGDMKSTLSVHFTLSGTATNGVDYASIPNPVLMPPGISYVSIPVKTKVDSIREIKESVTMKLSLDNAYTIGSPSAATVTIVDSTAVDSRRWSMYE